MAPEPGLPGVVVEEVRARTRGGTVMTIRLAIVDNHTLVRNGLRELVSLQPDIEVVAECTSATSASSS
jgi:hypothetical protein